jgi:hypothetical protein
VAGWNYPHAGGTRPKAALFGFCLALVAYNMLAVVMAALRSVPGANTRDQELSLYDVANNIAQTYHGMMIASPEDAWRIFSRMRPAEMAGWFVTKSRCRQAMWSWSSWEPVAP